MVILKEPLSRAIILGFKGTVDFYTWKGIPVARRWPRTPRQPRSAAVQAQYADFRFVTQSYKDLSKEVIAALTSMTSGTQLTQKDESIQLFYGYGIYSAPGSIYPDPPQPVRPDRMLEADLATSTTASLVSLPVSSAVYISRPNLNFAVDFSLIPFNRFRVLIQGQCSTSSQTVTAQLALLGAPGVPLSAAGNDLVIPNANAFYDSGWIAIPSPPAISTPLTLALVGSNASANLQYNAIRILFDYAT